MNRIEKIVFVFISSVVIIGCRESKDEINTLINSGDACERIKGFDIIGQNKDTAYLAELLSYSKEDKKICHSMNFYGKTALWSKIRALEKLTGVKYPHDYNAFTLDSSSLVIYRNLLSTNPSIFNK